MHEINKKGRPLDLINVVKLEDNPFLAIFAFTAFGILVDSSRVGDLPILLERTRLIRRVLEDNVRLLVLVLTEANQHNVASVDPHLFPQLATDMTQTLHRVKARRLAATVAEHAQYLGIL